MVVGVMPVLYVRGGLHLDCTVPTGADSSSERQLYPKGKGGEGDIKEGKENKAKIGRAHV